MLSADLLGVMIGAIAGFIASAAWFGRHWLASAVAPYARLRRGNESFYVGLSIFVSVVGLMLAFAIILISLAA